MSRYIEADTVIKYLESEDYLTEAELKKIRFWINSIPCSEMKRARHGKWLKVPSATHKDIYFYDCSVCKATYGQKAYKGLFDMIEWSGGTNLYCPHCGAKMDGGEK